MGFIITTILVFFAINCLFLIFLVMVQTGKGGGGVGGMLGGGSSASVFGASTADVMTKITRGAALTFIILSLLLSFLFAKKDDRLIPEDSLNPTIDPISSETPSSDTIQDTQPQQPQGQ